MLALLFHLSIYLLLCMLALVSFKLSIPLIWLDTLYLAWVGLVVGNFTSTAINYGFLIYLKSMSANGSFRSGKVILIWQGEKKDANTETQSWVQLFSPTPPFCWVFLVFPYRWLKCYGACHKYSISPSLWNLYFIS